MILSPLESDDGLPDALRRLATERGYTTILVEAGGGLLGRLFHQGLINDALVFIAPTLLGDQDAPGSVRGHAPARIVEGIALRPLATFPRSNDVVAWYRVAD